jgi:hypothetical protein
MNNKLKIKHKNKDKRKMQIVQIKIYRIVIKYKKIERIIREY